MATRTKLLVLIPRFFRIIPLKLSISLLELIFLLLNPPPHPYILPKHFPPIPSLPLTMNPSQEHWAMFYRNKIIPLGDDTINMIRRDPTHIMGWFEKELMEAWLNIFPLTETSRQLGSLLITDEVWILTPNPWWRFVTDRPALLPIPLNNSNPFVRSSILPLSELSLCEMKADLLEPVITERKILVERLVECATMGNIHRVKLFQFLAPKIKHTILVKCTEWTLGVWKYSVTLFSEVIRAKTLLKEAWSLRDIGDNSSPIYFDSSTNPFVIMNVLIWNCRGALKPFFRQTVLDLVNWHHPIIMVITETRLSGVRAKGIMASLSFDGAVCSDTIRFAGGIWLLWRTDLVNVEVLSTTKQEIHALIRVSSQSFSWILSAIYASPRLRERLILWDNLKLLAGLHNLPWALMGILMKL